MPHEVYSDYIDQWATETPDKVWLRDRKGDDITEWTWSQARDEINAAAAALEAKYGSGEKMAILSKNRAHWMLADMAIIASGSVSIPMFVTLPPPTTQYVLEFSETKVIFLGEADNWESIKSIVPAGVEIVCFPGVSIDEPHTTWEALLADFRGKRPNHKCTHDELLSLVFTSGTTGMPKGVMQTHDSMLLPIVRFLDVFRIRENPRFLSYLPLSHIAERQLVEGFSIVTRGEVTFNEGLPQLFRDLQATRPNFFFGAPRVWEQVQQVIIGQFGSQEAIDQALAADEAAARAKVDAIVGLGDSDYCLTAAAPTPPALIHWFGKLGIQLLEGFGQTEAMGLVANTRDDFRIGSIGKPGTGVEIKLSEEEELLVKAEGLSPGYYKQPDKTAELHQNGWLHTGDKARIDEDGFIFLTGRVKDYFKTIQGKYVAPAPIESAFADNEFTEQICLLGRGYSKTVMVGIVSELAQKRDKAEIEAAMKAQVEKVNAGVEKHARLGGAILATDPWTIQNEVLTPTMKIRRERVEGRFGEQAQRLARESAEKGEILVEWA